MATSGKVPLSYKAALLKPAPPQPEVGIISHDWKSPYAPIVEECIANVERARYTPMELQAIRPVVEFEGIELNEYVERKGKFYSILKKDLEWLAKRVGKNILAYVGHVEQFDDFMDNLIYHLERVKSIDKIKAFNPALETIIIIVACYSGEYAHYYNNRNRASFKVLQKYNIALLGFANLVHIYQGEIYVCFEPHNRIKSLDCAYPEAFDDKMSIVQNKNEGKDNQLQQCCQSKFDRFKSLFVEDLSNRSCGKITKEVLLKAILNLLTPEQKIDTSKLFFLDPVNIGFDQGVPCPSEGCKPINPFKGQERIADSFDKAEELIVLGKKIIDWALNFSEEKLLNKIQSLEPSQREALYLRNYIMHSGTVIFDLLFYKKYRTLLFIFKHFQIPIGFVGAENKNFFCYAPTVVPLQYEDKLFELCYALYKYSTAKEVEKITAMQLYDFSNYSCLYYMIRYRHISLIEFNLFYADRYANVETVNYNPEGKPILMHACDTYLFDSYVWKLLLTYGANPRNKATIELGPATGNTDQTFHLTPIEYILKFIPPPFPKDILELCCIFGHTDEEFLYHTYTNFRDVLENRGGETYQRYYGMAVSGLEVIRNAQVGMLLTNPDYYGTLQHRKNVEYLIEHFEEAIQQAYKKLEICLRIIRSSPERKKKMRQKIMKEVLQQLNTNMKTRIANIETKEKLPSIYGKLNKTLKRPNVRLRPNQKKSYRNRGLGILRNESRSVINRAQNLEELINSVLGKTPTTEENEFAGGKRATRKALRRC